MRGCLLHLDRLTPIVQLQQQFLVATLAIMAPEILLLPIGLSGLEVLLAEAFLRLPAVSNELHVLLAAPFQSAGPCYCSRLLGQSAKACGRLLHDGTGQVFHGADSILTCLMTPATIAPLHRTGATAQHCNYSQQHAHLGAAHVNPSNRMSSVVCCWDYDQVCLRKDAVVWVCSFSVQVLIWLQAVTQMLIDLLCQYTSPQAVAAAALAKSSDAQPEYADVGLFGGSPMELQSLILNAIMHDIHAPPDFEYLGKHAFPVCLPPLLEFAQTSMDRYVKADKTVIPLIDLRPYLKMLGGSLICTQRVTACHSMSPLCAWQQQYFLPCRAFAGVIMV